MSDDWKLVPVTPTAGMLVRAVCRVRCEFYNEKPCFEDGGEWPNEDCAPDCRTIAALAIASWNMLPPPRKGTQIAAGVAVHLRRRREELLGPLAT